MANWTDRIGSDLWRNVLAEECKAMVAHINEAPVGMWDISGADLQPPPSGEGFCFRHLSDGPIYRQSVLIFQTGRTFLLGPTRTAVDFLVDAAARLPLPRHVALLSWRKEHVEGLPRLIRAVNNDVPVTIWTSEWIWEEVHRLLSTELGTEFTIQTPEQVAARIKKTEDPRDPETRNRNVVICFTRSMRVELTLGVRLHAHYVPGHLPSLRLLFECNGIWKSFQPIAALSAQQLQELRKDVLERARHPDLRREVAIRYADLEAAAEIDETRAHRDSAGWRIPGRSPCAGGVDLSARGRTLSDVKFRPAPLHRVPSGANAKLIVSDAISTQTVDRQRVILNEAVFMILCAGFSAGKGRAFLHPGRNINVSPKDGPPKVLSILEWRLLQLHKLANAHGVDSLPVLLVTSPETSELVAEHVARFHDLLKGPPAALDTICLAQDLVPLFIEGKGNHLAPFECSDGGWLLRPRGHLDAIRLLHTWFSKQQAGRRKVAVLFAHNNLGTVVSSETVERLGEFLNCGAIFGAEMFRLKRQAGDEDARWELMSYDVADARFRLYKKRAYAPNGDSGGRLEPFSYSSNTWFVNLDLLRTVSDQPVWSQLFGHYVVSAVTEGSGKNSEISTERPTWRLRQDLDQIAHHDELECRPIRSEHEPLPGLLGHPRFLVARDEDHIRTEEFREAFQKARHPELPIVPTMPVPTDFLVLPLAASAMDDIWGGDEIARRKGIPNFWETRISETWEASTHPSGPSLVYCDARRSVALPEVLASTAKAGPSGPSDGQLRYMAKYLDCHENLSVQLHPHAAAARFLHDKNRQLLPGGKARFRLVDDWGKEESFYVLKASPGEQNLILGFERESLRPMAEKLLGTIARETTIVREFDILRACRNILPELGDLIVERFARKIIKEFLGSAPRLEERVRTPFCNGDAGDPRSLIAVLRYHTEELPKQLGSASGAVSLLGKEYLFVAIGIISAIQSIATFDWESEAIDSNLRENVQKLFKGTSGPWNNSPLYSYFHRERLEAGFWGSVPPGMVHAWQGGGNFLVELAERSDNTFRILDWGRELRTATRRDMHYVEAMYSLSESSIVSTDAAKRLTFEAKRSVTMLTPRGESSRSRAVPADHARESVQSSRREADRATGVATDNLAAPCHAGLAYVIPDFRVRGTDEWITLESECSDFSLLMNPDNPLQVRARACVPGVSVHDKSGGQFIGSDAIQLTLPPATAALVNKNVSIALRSQQADDTVLHISKRADRDNLLVVSLGTSRLELVLYGDRLRPPTTSRILDVSPPNLELALTETLRGEMSSWSKVNSGPEMPEMDIQKRIKSVRRVGLVWPGPIDECNNARKLYSSDWGSFDEAQVKGWFREGLAGIVPDLHLGRICVKSDTAVTALGEIRHPLGGLSAKDPATDLKPGTVLNLGGGVCAGFTSELKSPVSELGRWLYYDTRTGVMKPRLPAAKSGGTLSDEEKKAAISKAVYCNRPEDRDDVRIRVSRIFSFVGILLRFLDRLSDKDRPKFLEDCGIKDPGRQNIEIYCKSHADLHGVHSPYKRQLVLHQMNQAAVNANNADLRHTARVFMIEVAGEMAQLIKEMKGMLELFHENAPPFTDEVILTGSVGQYFGRTDEGDLLVDTISRRLPMCSIRRSNIARASYRETEGFLLLFEQEQLITSRAAHV